MFPGVQKTTWSYDRDAKAWYFHRFYDFQPDLNTSNREVQAEILKIMGFWIQAGRIWISHGCGPVHHFDERSKRFGNRKKQFDMLRTFREFLQWRQGDCIVLAEANVLPDTDMDYFGEDGERMHMMFNFQVNQRPVLRACRC